MRAAFPESGRWPRREQLFLPSRTVRPAAALQPWLRRGPGSGRRWGNWEGPGRGRRFPPAETVCPGAGLFARLDPLTPDPASPPARRTPRSAPPARALSGRRRPEPGEGAAGGRARGPGGGLGGGSQVSRTVKRRWGNPGCLLVSPPVSWNAGLYFCFSSPVSLIRRRLLFLHARNLIPPGWARSEGPRGISGREGGRLFLFPGSFQISAQIMRCWDHA